MNAYPNTDRRITTYRSVCGTVIYSMTCRGPSREVDSRKGVSLSSSRRQKNGDRRLIEISPLEQLLEESGEPHLIIDRAGSIVFETATAKSLLGAAITLTPFDIDRSLADLLAEWFEQRQCVGYTGSVRLKTGSGGSSAMCLAGSTIEYRGARHLLCHLRADEQEATVTADLWSEVTDAARESAFVAAGAVVEHELNQSLAAIVNYIQTSAILLNGRAEGTPLVQNALSEAGQQALHCAELLRELRGRFGYQVRALERHSLSGVVRQAHALLTQTRKGSAARLELQGAESELFVQLSHSHFVSMSMLLMQRCLRSRRPRNIIKVSIAAEGSEHAVMRFLHCDAWQRNRAAAERGSMESHATESDDARLLAICQATMNLHGGYVSIAEDSGKGSEIRLTLKKATIEEDQRA